MSGRGAAGHYRTGWSSQRVARDIELHDIEHGWSDRQLASIIYRALRGDDEVAYKVLPDILRRLFAALDLGDHAAANMIRAELRAATAELKPVMALFRQEAS